VKAAWGIEMGQTMRALLTGGSGDLGKVLTPRLVSSGLSVTSLDPSIPTLPDIEHVQGSILDRELTNNTIKHVDLVVHIAAWHGLHAFRGSRTASEFWDLNMTGTFNVLDACARSGTRKVVFISSSSVDEWPDMYGVTKLLGEELCRSYAERDGLQILALRPRAFIPWWNTDVYTSKVEWAKWFARGAIHINDVAESALLACQTLLRSERPLFESLALDGKQDLSKDDRDRWSNVGGRVLLKEKFPSFESLIDSADFIPSDPPTYKDISRAREILGFEPSYGLRELLTEMSEDALKESKSV